MDVSFPAFFMLFIVIPSAVLFGIMTWAQSASCYATAAAMNVPANYSIWTDCMVTIKGQTIPLSAYKVVGVQ